MPLILQLCCPRCKRHWKRRIEQSGTSPYDAVEAACRLGLAVTFDVLGPVDRPCPNCGKEMHYGFDATKKMPWFSLWILDPDGKAYPNWFRNDPVPFFGGRKYEYEGPFSHETLTISAEDAADVIGP